MSAPGADPLAAIRIRQRYASYISSDRLQADVLILLKQWDTRESALRALVAQWRDESKYEDTARAMVWDDCADALERLLSGPQP